MANPMPDTTYTTRDGAQPLSIARILNSHIVTANHRRIGRVVDIEVSPDQSYQVTALLFGSYGWFVRLRILQRLMTQLGVSVKPHRIPWCGVAHIEPGKVILRHRLVEKQ